jgi:GR25 family glycosyltransferase involved in LPS biosynthesis
VETKRSMAFLGLNKRNTFCISLATANIRRSKMKRRFSQHSLDVTFWDACSITDIKDQFLTNLSAGEKACAQSHICLWRKIIQEKMPFALILEDDACFDERWHERLDSIRDIVTKYDPEWHAFLLNASEPLDVLDTWLPVQEQYLTGGYLLSYSGAIRLIEKFQNQFAAADWMTSRLQLDGHTYGYFPWLIIQEGKDSSIGSNFDADHEKVLRCLKSINYARDHYGC